MLISFIFAHLIGREMKSTQFIGSKNMYTVSFIILCNAFLCDFCWIKLALTVKSVAKVNKSVCVYSCRQISIFHQTDLNNKYRYLCYVVGKLTVKINVTNLYSFAIERKKTV